MSGIAAIIGRRGRSPGERPVCAMLAAMSARGGDQVGTWAGAGAVLGAARFDWEMEPGFSGTSLVTTRDGVAVAADASLYYRGELRRALRAEGVVVDGDTPGDLILGAYRAWGADCTDRLEGDWAFILWDGAKRRLLCCRDFGGRRPLFYADLDDALVVASSISALLAHPGASRELNLASIAADAAGWFAEPHETCYRDFRALPAGSTLTHGGQTTRVTPHWSPPPVRATGTLSFADAADELRSLLVHAVDERLSGSGPTSVWLSGGWDSTAVFAAGEQALRRRRQDGHLRPVSVSYPPGDSGREDELIQAVGEHWSAPIHWLDIADIPLLDRPGQRAAHRDEPFAHAFEMMHRALARGSRAVGSHVAFDGAGGDQLFSVSPVYLADLLRTGHWLQLMREWRTGRTRSDSARSFARWAMLPLVPAPLRHAANDLLGNDSLRHHLERPTPAWIRSDFVQEHDLLGREQAHTPLRTGGSHASYEMQWYLTHAFFPRVVGQSAQFALEHGVETRAPLYDRRIIEFAATRPVAERARGKENKRLLRRSMHGLLPEQVLRPRPHKTGTTGDYLDRSLRRLHGQVIRDTFNAPMLLAELGIVDPVALRRNWNGFLRHGDGNAAINLFHTFQTEMWLRGRYGGLQSQIGRTSTPMLAMAMAS